MIIDLNNYEEITHEEYSSISGQSGRNKLILWDEGKQKHYKKKDENRIFKSELSDLSIEFIKKWAIIHQEKNTLCLGNYPNKRWELIEKALNYAKENQ